MTHNNVSIPNGSEDHHDRPPHTPLSVTNKKERKLMIAQDMLGTLPPESAFRIWLQLSPQIKVHPHYKSFAGHYAEYSKPMPGWELRADKPIVNKETRTWRRDGTEPF